MDTNINDNAPRIERVELGRLINDDNTIILDVRQEGSWNSSSLKIKGALREVPAEFNSWFNKYPKDKKLVLYCS